MPVMGRGIVTHQRCQIAHGDAPRVGLVAPPGVAVPQAVGREAWRCRHHGLPEGEAIEKLPKRISHALVGTGGYLALDRRGQFHQS